MKRSLLLLFCFTPLLAFCQDLTGTWEGSGGGTTYIKMVLVQKGDSLYGYTYDEGSGFCKASFAGRFNQSAKKLTGHGITMIDGTENHVLVNYNLNYSKESRGEYLRERARNEDESFIDRLFGSDRAPQYLRKVSTSTDPLARSFVPKRKAPVITAKRPTAKPVPVKPAPVPVPAKPVPPVVKASPKKPPVVVNKTKPAPPVVKKPEPVLKKDPLQLPEKEAVVKVPAEPVLKVKEARASKLVRTITTSADTLKIFVYDNGEVDGDTVTIFVDNKVVLNRYRITEKAREISIPISNGQTKIIDLFANNLGSIPPNTALIIIIAGKERHELYASYDLKTNARIVIEHKPQN